MGRHTYRTLLIFSVLIISLILIYPTIGWMTLPEQERAERLEQWADEDAQAERRSFFGDIQHGLTRWAQFDRDQVIDLGLDLQGGIHMVIGFDMTEEAIERGLTEEQVQDMILQRVRNRVDEFEAQEPIIQALGNNQVQIQLPGEKDTQRAKDLIMRTAFLTFHMVAGPEETEQIVRRIDAHFDNGFVPYLREIPGGQLVVPAENIGAIRALLAQAEQVPELLPEGKTIAFSAPPNTWEEPQYYLYIMDEEAGMTGEGLTRANAVSDPQRPGQWMIAFTFNTDAARDFAELTGANVGRNMAIVLDNNVVSAPVINQQIFANGSIEGNFNAEEANDLAIALNSGSMPVPIREEYAGVVDASLGADSVRAGVYSAIIGILLVMVFMIVYYRVGGVIANVALLFNAIMLLGAMAYFNATLTLPGIAGLILTIGMAVDANVLIFERIREELRNGKSLLSSIESGYSRALVTILDANVTTLIAAFVLMQFGTGPVQGFAVTLSIGIVTSVFSSVLVTRALLDFMVARKYLTTLNMMSFFKPDATYDFMGKRRIAYIISIVVILIGVGAFIYRGSDNLGVDFTTGTNMTVAINSEDTVTAGAVREALEQAGFTSPTVQRFSAVDLEHPNQFNIRVNETGGDAVDNATAEDSVAFHVQTALADLAAPGATLEEGIDIRESQTVGPAVGRRLQRDAIQAVTFAMLFIIAYLWFRFEFRYAIGAAAALVHDVLVTVGIFALAGREITVPMVAALLTIIGYSLNDTIVVFDRVRETLRTHRGRGLPFMELLNISMNETLGRTILTSVTTLFVVFVLFLFGGIAINDFAFALLVGIIAGTYSTVFIASPVVAWWQNFRDRRRGPEAIAGERGPGSKKKKKRVSEQAPA